MIVYKVLTGNHPYIINEDYFDPRIKYYYFHTHEIKNKSGKWKFIKIPVEQSLLYTQRKYKILSHKLFEEPSIYLDFNYKQKPNFYENNIKLLNENSYTVGKHHFRSHYIDEICDWLILFAEINTLIKITRYLKYIKYNFNVHFGCECGYLCRDNSKQTKELNNMWWHFWKKFKKRDQLFFPVATYFTKNKVNLVDTLKCMYVVTSNVMFRKKPKNITNEIPNFVKQINLITKRTDTFNSKIITYRL